MDNDNLHEENQNKTGFWGSRGAGCLLLSAYTGRFLFGQRSADVDEPLTWGGWGGAVDPGDSSLRHTVTRELLEEAGYAKELLLTPLCVYTAPGFKYYNFLGQVDDEFIPKLSKETSDFCWASWDEFPTPYHFGLLHVMQNSSAREKLRTAAMNTTKKYAHAIRADRSLVLDALRKVSMIAFDQFSRTPEGRASLLSSSLEKPYLSGPNTMTFGLCYFGKWLDDSVLSPQTISLVSGMLVRLRRQHPGYTFEMETEEKQWLWINVTSKV